MRFPERMTHLFNREYIEFFIRLSDEDLKNPADAGKVEGYLIITAYDSIIRTQISKGDLLRIDDKEGLFNKEDLYDKEDLYEIVDMKNVYSMGVIIHQKFIIEKLFPECQKKMRKSFEGLLE